MKLCSFAFQDWGKMICAFPFDTLHCDTPWHHHTIQIKKWERKKTSKDHTISLIHWKLASGEFELFLHCLVGFIKINLKVIFLHHVLLNPTSSVKDADGGTIILHLFLGTLCLSVKVNVPLFYCEDMASMERSGHTGSKSKELYSSSSNSLRLKMWII